MKKIALLLMVLSVSLSYGQKKKKKASTASASAGVLAKSGDASVAYNKKKDLFLVVAKDSMLLTKSRTDFNPANVKITPVKVKTNTFYCVTWNETVKTDTKLKKETAAVTENQLWNPATKTLLIGNTQKAVEVQEIVFLDKLKTASETQYKKRSEGFEFQLLPNGEFLLKNKTKSTKYAYNEKTSRYEVKK
ncbi:hypothetical protein NAT51_02255 [Flavobacterium amniphilum]|uniref:hypothetical protein n=1 Tax=Flavobacterium amniphilum TaxID=1834035 RepID=UPI002029EA19|nr:hypothetical protein [Flavobacterium amniphilum]MCL9804330.1 hypothetical protein [Flavobacterium amniphilum]